MRDMARILAAAGLRAEPMAGAGRGSASTVGGLLDDAEPRVAVESVGPPVRIPASVVLADRTTPLADGGPDRLPSEEPGVETLREALRLVVAHRPGATEETSTPAATRADTKAGCRSLLGIRALLHALATTITGVAGRPLRWPGAMRPSESRKPASSPPCACPAKCSRSTPPALSARDTSAIVAAFGPIRDSTPAGNTPDAVSSRATSRASSSAAGRSPRGSPMTIARRLRVRDRRRASRDSCHRRRAKEVSRRDISRLLGQKFPGLDGRELVNLQDEERLVLLALGGQLDQRPREVVEAELLAELPPIARITPRRSVSSAAFCNAVTGSSRTTLFSRLSPVARQKMGRGMALVKFTHRSPPRRVSSRTQCGGIHWPRPRPF